VGASPGLTVAQLLERWMAADHPWKPSTRIGYSFNTRHLTADETVARLRVADLTPRHIRAAFARWEAQDATPSVIGGRFRVLRSAVGWAYDERVLERHPLRHMRGPGRVEPRRPITDDDLTALLQVAECRVLEAVANAGTTRASIIRKHRVEQDLLLTQIAADSGARRGEIAALQFEDLRGRVLTIARSLSGATLTTPKSGLSRSLTLGSSTTELWRTLAGEWGDHAPEGLGPWLFSADVGHSRPLTAGALGHRFARLCTAAGVAASLHRLRHNVATFLVARGEILQAQARLGHADAATTMREYAYALPLSDGEVADAIDVHLDRRLAGDLEQNTGPQSGR
jgi:integrase